MNIEDLTILLVDDESNVLSALRRFLIREPYQQVFAESGEQALEIVGSREIHVIVTDLRMPGMHGLELLERLKLSCPEIVRVVLSATSDMEHTIASINSGEVFRFIPKPLDSCDFRGVVREAAENYLLMKERQTSMGELAAANVSLHDALQRVERVNNEKRRLQEISRDVERRIGEEFLQADCPTGVKGVSLAAVTLPARHLDGDFYDCIIRDDECFDVVMGDVMGKGVHSALVGAGLKFIMLKEVIQQGQSGNSGWLDHDREVLESWCQLIHQRSIAKLVGLEMFATLCLARFNLNLSAMTYVDCGHTKTLQFRDNSGDCHKLWGDNLPLGMEENTSYLARSVNFEEGDVFLFYSDGVTEAENLNGELFGSSRLEQLLVDRHWRSSEGIVEDVVDTVRNYVGERGFNDDFTCLAVKIGKGDSSPIASPMVGGESCN